jgi:hypothetical protein
MSGFDASARSWVRAAKLARRSLPEPEFPMHRIRTLTFFLILAVASDAAWAADRASRIQALFDAVVFFGGMFALMIYALVMRLRDARAGLNPDERQVRMRKRLPWVMGGMMGLVFYTLFRTGI